MFKKLKEKIAEEVKPLKIPQFAQSAVSPGSNAVSDSSPNEPLSLEDELPVDSLGSEGFSVVDLHHPSLPVPLPSGRFSRQSSISSLASDASAFLPIHDASLGSFNMQDFESASEREDVLPQMNNLSKQEVCNSYLKLYRHYQKYKGRAADLKSFCRELEKDNKKHKTVLLECQEKSLRRMAELKEQCALEQHAKAHLEEALRNDLEEKDHLIETLQTKIKLLKEARSANSSPLTSAEDKILLSLSGVTAGNCQEDLSLKGVQKEEQQSKCEPERKPERHEIDMKSLKDHFEYLKEQILKDSRLNTPDMTEFKDLLNEISVCLVNKEISSLTMLYKHENLDENKTPEALESNIILFEKIEKNFNKAIGNEMNDLILESVPALGNIQLSTQNLVHDAEQDILKQSYPSADGNLTDILEHSETYMCHNKRTKYCLTTGQENELETLKANFEKLTEELETSQQTICEQNSTITKLHERLITLRNESEACNECKYIQTMDTVNTELVTTKLKFEDLQQQLFFFQKQNNEKDLLMKETEENVNKLQSQLETILDEKSNTTNILTILQSELVEMKNTCEQQTHQIHMAHEERLLNESIVEKLNKEISRITKELEKTNYQKVEGNEMAKFLQNELKETKVKYEQIVKELQMLSFQKDASCEIISTLTTELKDQKLCFEEAAEELQSVQILIKEKEDIIIEINEELAHVHQSIDTLSKEKVESEVLLQNQLSDANLQIEKWSLELQNALQLNNLKESEMNKITGELTNVQKNMEIMSIHNEEMIKALQTELSHSKSHAEELTQKLHAANQLVEEKENDIVNMKQDFENQRKKLEMASLSNNEKSKIVTYLENDLTETKVQMDKVTEEINTYHELIKEKDLVMVALNNNLTTVQKNLEVTISQKVEVNKMADNLQNELVDMKKSLEKITGDLQSAQKLVYERGCEYSKVSEELSMLHKEFDEVTSEKNNAMEMAANLQKELMNMSKHFRDLTEELQLASTSLEEKDLKIACLTEDISNAQEFQNTISIEKEEFNKKLSFLKKELTDSKLQLEQVTQEIQLAQLATKEKDLMIARLSEELSKMAKDMEIISLQKDEAHTLIIDLQDELKEIRLNFEHKSKESLEAQELIKEKDSVIAVLSADGMKINKELISISASKDETCELVTSLQRELRNFQLSYDKISEELTSSHRLLEEKDLFISKLKEDIVKIKRELNETSTLHSQANEKVSELQIELKETKVHLVQIIQGLQCANQLLGEDQLVPLDNENENSVIEKGISSKKETLELVLNLQNKLESTIIKLEKTTEELQSAQRIIKEKDSSINKLNELEDVNRKLNTVGHKDESEHIKTTSRSGLLDNKLPIENSEEISSSEFSSQVNVPSDMVSDRKQPCFDGSEVGRKTVRQHSCKNSSSETKSGGIVINRDQKLDGQQDTSIMVSNSSVCQELVSVLEVQDSSSYDNHITNSSNVMNISEVDPVSKDQMNSENTSSLEYFKFYGEESGILKSGEEDLQTESELSSWTVAEFSRKEATNSNMLEDPPSMDLDERHQIDQRQFPSIQSVLEEIQKANTECGYLLECHKNIINHLERIAKRQGEKNQPGSADWLHKQVILLSKKMYHTREKQRLQISRVNRLFTNQQSLESDCNENNMTIEMQYLRNIIFQYMIGKETLLLAKVISAVMKFDQQQMDQIMQKELQKQTLFGQLGLL